MIHRMVDEQSDACARYGIDAPLLLGRRRLHAIDCQNLFCELDKYARVRYPELRSNRTRIKATFTPSTEPLTLYYPPKWGLSSVAQPADELADRGLRPAHWQRPRQRIVAETGAHHGGELEREQQCVRQATLEQVIAGGGARERANDLRQM